MQSQFSRVWLLVTLWTVACQAPLSMGFSRQEYWSGLPFPSPRHLLSIINPSSPSDLFLWRQFSCSMEIFDKQSIVRGSTILAKNWTAKFNALRPLQETEGWTSPSSGLFLLHSILCIARLTFPPVTEIDWLGAQPSTTLLPATILFSFGNLLLPDSHSMWC